ncbi:MAG: DUF4336 domain-containing protein [Deltaproteobacteria bacterium]|nr:DUF4336 domain-containing protein [Deltaproteobacteria bacterium]MCB9787203.1 DUF4336 domain-containing protein [Deltaproteobacteria bacterium]
MLEVIAPDLYVAAAPFRAFGVDLGARMTVVRLPSGDLWMHSPIRIDDALADAVTALGPLRHIVAPSAFHHLFVRGWMDRFPAATLHAPDALGKKRRDLAIHRPLAEEPDPAWGGVIATCHIDGAPMADEWVFLHEPTRALITTDSLFHFIERPDWPRWKRTYLRLTAASGGVRTSRVFRFIVRDRAAFRASMERVLAWAPDRLIPAHGEVLPTGAAAAVREGLGWLLDEAGPRP